MTDRFRPASDGRKKSLWQKIVDISLTDVTVLVKGIDEDTIENLERVLLEADFGIDATVELVDEMERAARRGSVKTERDLRELLGNSIRRMLAPAETSADAARSATNAAPWVTLLVGVNGTGKTTTAARLARRALDSGDKVLLAACDTFRSGAQEQLKLWADRLGTDFVGGRPKADPAAVAFDAAEAAVSRRVDRLIVDTAGRLQTQQGLMEELRKIDRVLGRVINGAPHERLLVVDATSGQNVVNQAKVFGEALDLDGLVLSKFDSSGRGGAAVAVARAFDLPVRYLGMGEGEGDLEPFDADRYVEKLLESE
ncbi:MAG: signal recognition particle-docking protein FtsY [Gemmatimonadota bacterium]